MRTLKISLFATVLATGAWMLGISQKLWPAHPFWANFLLTCAALVLAYYIWPKPQEK